MDFSTGLRTAAPPVEELGAQQQFVSFFAILGYRNAVRGSMVHGEGRKREKGGGGGDIHPPSSQI